MSYSIIKADLDRDRTDIITFWRNNFSVWPVSKFQYFYKDNICGKARCWMIKESAKNLVIGITSIFPRNFALNGHKIKAGITGDFAVAPKHRILGPAIKLQKSSIKQIEGNDVQFLYGYPNRKSEPVQKRAGFNILGHTSRFVKILKTDKYIKQKITNSLVVYLFSFFADLLLRLFYRETYFTGDKRFVCEEIDSFDNRFDELWKIGQTQFKLIGERNHEFLNWRFQNCDYIDYKKYIIKDRKTNAVFGYIVYRIESNTVNISDCFFVNYEILQPLISCFVKHVRKQGFSSISVIYFGHQRFESTLKRFRFFKRADTRNIIFYKFSHANISDNIFSQENWHFLEADND